MLEVGAGVAVETYSAICELFGWPQTFTSASSSWH